MRRGNHSDAERQCDSISEHVLIIIFCADFVPSLTMAAKTIDCIIATLD
jgi:hypothetical protein